jgi:hypothetical protein
MVRLTPQFSGRALPSEARRESRYELFDALRDNGIGLRSMVPVPDRSVAVTQQKVAFHIRADDAHFLATPPIRSERTPVGMADQASNGDASFTAPKRAPLPEILQRPINWFDAVRHVA